MKLTFDELTTKIEWTQGQPFELKRLKFLIDLHGTYIQFDEFTQELDGQAT